MKRFVVSAVASISLLANCAGDLPKRSFVKSDEAVKQREAEWDNKPAITTVRLPGRFFLSEPVHTTIPADVGKRKLDITMPGGAATLDDLIVILESQGLSVSYSWESANNSDDIGARRLPFRRFEGTVSELMERLQMGMSIATWWKDHTLYFSPLQRYTVKVPQNDEVIGVVEGQLESLGAQDIVSSLYAGQVTYSASPEANEELIAPFLRRLALNLSEITLQVALVRVSMNEAARRGFDWSNFNLSASRNVPSSSTSSSSSTSNSTGTGTTSTTGTTGTTTGTTATSTVGKAYQIGAGTLTGLGSATGTLSSSTASNSSSTGATTEGSAGVTGLLNSVPGLVAEASIGKLSLTAAIGLLSEFGTTSTDQNVELRTLAGQPVHLRDGGETPYVSQITSNATTGGNTSNTSSSVQFETVDTGLTLDLTPNFDASSGVVTVDVSLNVEDIESFLSLPSGTSFGNIERPVTSNRELTDLVRVAAGETVILGGVTKISKSDDRSAPLEFWSLGSDNSETDRIALFIIMRPFVTVYELDGNEMAPTPTNAVTSAKPGELTEMAPAPEKPAARIVEQSMTKPGLQSGVSTTPAHPPAPPVGPLAPPVAAQPPVTELLDGQSVPPSTPLPQSPPPQPAILPSRPAAGNDAPMQATPTSLVTTSGSGSSGYFDSLVGKILVQPAGQGSTQQSARQ